MEVIEIIRTKLNPWIGLIFAVGLILVIHNGSVLADSTEKPDTEPAVTASDDAVQKNTVKFESDEMMLEAVEINLVGEGLIEANGNAVLTMKNNGLRIETGQLTYDTGAGIVKAPGLVKVTNSQTVLMINSLTYNLKNNTGSGGALEGTITKTDDGRDSSVTGKKLEIKNETEVIEDATVTRCPRPDPDYIFKAKRVTMEGKRVHLASVVLYIKGIPVFYLPHLTLHPDQKRDFPEIQLNYDNTKGVIIKEQSVSAINDKLDFHTDVSIETLGKSNVGVGLGYQFTKPLANHVFVNNDLKGFWNIRDMVTYNTQSFLVVADALAPLSSGNEYQSGISITRKYWQGWGGNWQVGILARSVSKLDETATKYGGTYAGYQLDYKPVDNLTLSVLRLDNYEGSGIYKDFEVYTGYNLLYNWTVPLSTSFDLNLSGRYNFSGTDYLSNVHYNDPQYWISQKYDLIYNSCCWAINLGWDQVYKSWNFGAIFKL
jgi:hypothetical protein